MVTSYFIGCIMGNLFKGRTTPALPDHFYVGLSTTEPLADGTNVTEPSASSYSRVEITSLGAPINGQVKNEDVVLFPPASSSWGTITHYTLFDAATNGNLLMANALTTPRSIVSESQARFNVGALKFSLSDAE